MMSFHATLHATKQRSTSGLVVSLRQRLQRLRSLSTPDPFADFYRPRSSVKRDWQRL